MGGANAHGASSVLIHPPYIVNLFLSRGLDSGEDSSLINPQETGPTKYQQAAIPRRAGSFEGVGDAAGDFRCYPPLPIPVAEEMVLCDPDATLAIYIAEVARTFLSGWLGQFLKAAVRSSENLPVKTREADNARLLGECPRIISRPLRLAMKRRPAVRLAYDQSPNCADPKTT